MKYQITILLKCTAFYKINNKLISNNNNNNKNRDIPIIYNEVRVHGNKLIDIWNYENSLTIWCCVANKSVHTNT